MVSSASSPIWMHSAILFLHFNTAVIFRIPTILFTQIALNSFSMPLLRCQKTPKLHHVTPRISLLAAPDLGLWRPGADVIVEAPPRTVPESQLASLNLDKLLGLL